VKNKANGKVETQGQVFTFNDEIACRKSTALQITGAVPSGPLLSILEKLPDKMLDISETDDGTLKFVGKNKKFTMTRDAEILLPIDKVMEERPEEWTRLAENFREAVDAVKICASEVEDNFALTCVHLHPKHIQACNGYQLMRWRVPSGLKNPILVRADEIAKIVALDVTKVAETETWIHFRSPHGLILSCRKFIDDYPESEIDQAIKVRGEKLTLQKALADASERAAIFAEEVGKDEKPRVRVHLTRDKVEIVGTGLIGTYSEEKTAKYKGPEITFMASPTLLQHISSKFTETEVTETKLRATGGTEEKQGLWDYVTVLDRPKKVEGSKPEKKKKD
jgi:hypothetical protein